MFKEVSLVYFSSTKTTQRTVRAIGRALAKAFDIPVQEYDFTLPNARSRKLHFASDQLVVVGSPVYGGVMPLLVREYLAQMSPVKRLPVSLPPFTATATLTTAWWRCRI